MLIRYSKSTGHSHSQWRWLTVLSCGIIFPNHFFAINLRQNTHFSLTESDMSKCVEHPELRICPADHPVFTDTKSCLVSLFMQTKDVTSACARRLIPGPPEQTLSR